MRSCFLGWNDRQRWLGYADEGRSISLADFPVGYCVLNLGVGNSPTRGLSLDGLRGRFPPQLFHHHLQIFPGFFLLPGVAQQEGRVIRNRELRASPVRV